MCYFYLLWVLWWPLLCTLIINRFALSNPNPLITNSHPRNPPGIVPEDKNNTTGRIEDKCECGKRRTLETLERVVGGETTIPYEFPWLVRFAEIPCAGALINNRIILTAAHCFYKKGKTRPDITALFHVHRGGHSLYEENAIPYVSSQIFVHPDFVVASNKPNFTLADSRGDIALVVLDTPVNITDPIFNPVCLPEAKDKINLYEGRKATIAGWGIVSRKPIVLTRIPKKLEIEIHEPETCLQNNVFRDFNVSICAGPFDTNGSSPGDSGGPLFMDLPSKDQIQIGVVSHGADEDTDGHNGILVEEISIYTKITHYLPWIETYSKNFSVTWCKRNSNPT